MENDLLNWELMGNERLDRRLTHAMLRNDFKSFLRYAFDSMQPGSEFVNGWYLDVLTDYLQAAAEGSIRRLIINLPPRCLKSFCASVAWPAWIMGNNPSAKIIAASHVGSLSVSHSIGTRDIMKCDWYQKVFDGTKFAGDQNTKERFSTTMYGMRLAASVGGSLLGEGGDFLILDDPHNPMDVHSKKARDDMIRWFESVFMTRINNRNKGVVVVVMHRLHTEDLTGYLLAKQPDTWTVLSLPAIATEDISIVSINNKIYRRQKGDSLHPALLSESVVEEIKQEVGSYAFGAHYQQCPVVYDNGLLSRDRLFYYYGVPSGNMAILQSWDTAVGCGDSGDYSVCSTWGRVDDKFYLLDVFRCRLTYPELKKHVCIMFSRWNAEIVLVEDQSSGQQIIQELQAELPLVAFRSRLSKIDRFMSVLGVIEDGRVFLPSSAPWLECFVDELLSFPNGKYDDQVDTLVQLLQWHMGLNKYRLRVL